MELEQRIEQLEKTVASLMAQIDTMDLELEKASAEALATQRAITVIASFLPISERDATAALELAIATVEDAMPPDETPYETTLISLACVRRLFSSAGAAYRARKDERL